MSWPTVVTVVTASPINAAIAVLPFPAEDDSVDGHGLFDDVLFLRWSPG